MSPAALQSLSAAAATYRKREALAAPLEVQRQRLLSWLEARPDLEPPLPFGDLVLSRSLTAGRVLLLANDPQPWFVKLRGWTATPEAWLPLAPFDGIHISRISPVELLWDDHRPTRAAQVGAAVLLREAALGDAGALSWILKATGFQAAAQMVEQLADLDGLYEAGAGGVPLAAPSPRRLLVTAFSSRPRELEWLRELCDGAADWSDPDGGDLPVAQSEARRPGNSGPSVAQWINKA